MSPSTLHIQPESSANPYQYGFRLQGIIDVDAIPVLESLYALPAEAEVELDFAAVQRVNSMGLAQLLKLFEHWQSNRIGIRVSHANRMTGMLFRMSGLDRFLAAHNAPEAAANGGSASQNPAPPHRVRLQGVIDIDAIPVLEPLYGLPPKTAVELDFAEVQRVNSMGLAQLLKLFEHWQAHDVAIRVSNANRMIGMLFKMTGLDRFLTAQDVPQAAAIAVNGGPAPEFSARTASKPVAPAAPPARPETARTAPAPGTQALNWQVHMQSNQQLNGWYFLNTHLQRRLSLAAHLDIADNLLGSREPSAALPDLVFTKPFDAMQLISRHGFRPLARPSNQSDEVTILARADDTRESLEAFAGSRVAATSPDNFVYLLGRYLLDENKLASGSMQYLFAGHEIKAVQMLLKGEADLLFMHSESYQRLSGMTRRLVRELDRSEAQFAFHLWCLAPQRAELAGPLRDFLLSMEGDEPGRKVLAELGCTAWVEPAQEDIDMLERIFTLYGGAD
jgi:anti-anti-sigma regulatory factor